MGLNDIIINIHLHAISTILTEEMQLHYGFIIFHVIHPLGIVNIALQVKRTNTYQLINYTSTLVT